VELRRRNHHHLAFPLIMTVVPPVETTGFADPILQGVVTASTEVRVALDTAGARFLCVTTENRAGHAGDACNPSRRRWRGRKGGRGQS
jgi:hypothetical protein